MELLIDDINDYLDIYSQLEPEKINYYETYDICNDKDKDDCIEPCSFSNDKCEIVKEDKYQIYNEENKKEESDLKNRFYKEMEHLCLTYKINTTGKLNIGGYMGCFCPPHRGHFNQMVNAIKTFKLDILLINTMNSAYPYTRHGIPLLESLLILYDYCKIISEMLNVAIFIIPPNQSSFRNKILKRYFSENHETKYFNIGVFEGTDGIDKDGIKLEDRDILSFDEIMPIMIPDKTNKYKYNYYIRAMEEFETKNVRDSLDKPFMLNRKPIDGYSGYHNNYGGLALDRIYPEVKLRRGEDGLSATKFTECLINDEDCYQYLPEGISKSSANNIITRLKKRYNNHLHKERYQGGGISNL